MVTHVEFPGDKTVCNVKAKHMEVDYEAENPASNGNPFAIFTKRLQDDTIPANSCGDRGGCNLRQRISNSAAAIYQSGKGFDGSQLFALAERPWAT